MWAQKLILPQFPLDVIFLNTGVKWDIYVHFLSHQYNNRKSQKYHQFQNELSAWLSMNYIWKLRKLQRRNTKHLFLLLFVNDITACILLGSEYLYSIRSHYHFSQIQQQRTSSTKSRCGFNEPGHIYFLKERITAFEFTSCKAWSHNYLYISETKQLWVLIVFLKTTENSF